MQIFAINNYPFRIAEGLCNIHLSKQITELVQCMNQAMAELDITGKVFMKHQGSRKPIDWIKENKNNFAWCISLLHELLLEYDYRTNNHNIYDKHLTAREFLTFCNTLGLEYDFDFNGMDFWNLQSFNENKYPENAQFYHMTDDVAYNYMQYYTEKVCMQMKTSVIYTKRNPPYFLRYGVGWYGYEFSYNAKKYSWKLIKEV